MARIVVKVGSNLLVDSCGSIKKDYIAELVRSLALLSRKGENIALVSSGAKAAGYGYLNRFRDKKELYLKQALCAAGQVQLMKIYENAFDFYGIKIAQILLTKDDFVDRSRFLNLRNTLIGLTEMGIVPIVNENDTVATEEITLGDNDSLASKFSIGWNADFLVFLTSVEGVLDVNSNLISEYSPDIPLLSKSSTSWGSGGMKSKVETAYNAGSAGVETCICDGKNPSNIEKFVSGEKVGTHFVPVKTDNARKRWIGYLSEPKGEIILDKGAVEAVMNNNSILPVGIIDYSGKFETGDTVEIKNVKGNLIGRGIVNCSSDLASEVVGKNGRQIGNDLCKIFIHIDNFVNV